MRFTDEEEIITELEEKIYPLVNTTLQASDCSGVFFVLDATCNTKAPDTCEDVMLLCIPILDGNGNPCGICGVEISDLYFRLSYPPTDGSYGSLMTIVTSAEGSTLNLNNAMFGSSDDRELKQADTLVVKKERFYNVYSSGEADYIGLTGHLTGKCVDGTSLSVITLLSKDNYEAVISLERKIWILGSLAFFLIMLALSWIFTKHFVTPISKVLTDIREDFPMEEYHSGISELDELVEFMQYKARESNQKELPPNVEELLQSFVHKVSGLTPMERTVLQYYIEGCSVEEVAAQAFISVNTVKKHNTNMNRKLGISNREELMLYIDLFRRCGRLDEISSDKL